MMLGPAVAASLPLIAVHTTDTVNMAEVIEHITGRKPVSWNGSTKVTAKSQLYVAHGGDGYGPWYSKMVELASTLVVVNPKKLESEMFNAGELPVPRELITDFMSQVATPDKVPALVRTLGGVTLKEAAELAMLTMSRDLSLTPAGIVQSRMEYFQAQKGLTLVDPKQDFYLPDPSLHDWIEQEKPFFVNGVDQRLVPRGLLLDGPPGVGKTSGAKYLAERWEVPLYRVDVSGTKDKYVGESERFLAANLARLDQEEPCIALFDEVEKVFASSHNDTSGTTTSMLSQILWWLAERKSRVLVVMTTNKAKALPPELYREGRIDKHMVFSALNKESAELFAKSVVHTFHDMITKYSLAVKLDVSKLFPKGTLECSHAAVVAHVNQAVKEAYLQKHLSP